MELAEEEGTSVRARIGSAFDKVESIYLRALRVAASAFALMPI